MRAGEVYRFGDFVLDVDDRRLLRAGAPVDLTPRYFDALVLLVGEHGRLVDKDRFFGDVWGGVVVGDETLTQCIKALRRALGDDASRPRFIQTVPKHGYRFLADVAADHGSRPTPVAATATAVSPAEPAGPGIVARTAVTAIAGAVGGGVAGAIGGLIYGVVIILNADAEIGRSSMLVVLLALNVVVAGLGGFGLGAGLGAARALTALRWLWIPGAALGGFAIGGATELLGVDAFQLVLGRSPGNITGAWEGAILGAGLGLGLALGSRRKRWTILLGGLGTGLAGLAVVLLGGQMMAGSLALLGASLGTIDIARSTLDPFLTAMRFGVGAEPWLAVLEGLLFGMGVSAALVRTRLRGRPIWPIE